MMTATGVRLRSRNQGIVRSVAGVISCIYSARISTVWPPLGTSLRARSALEWGSHGRPWRPPRGRMFIMNTDPNRMEHCLERRGAQRFEVSLPLAIHFDGRTVHGFAQDLSGRGIFFYAETALPEGAVVELTFTMPAEITLGESMPVRCRGRVLRAGAAQAGHGEDGHSQDGRSQDNQRSGIAVQLDAYEYLPADESSTHFVRVSRSEE